jgi:hypothetical protein
MGPLRGCSIGRIRIFAPPVPPVQRCFTPLAPIADMLADMSRSLWFAHAFWPRFYRTLAWFDPAIERVWRLTGLGNVVRVTVIGRRSRRPRSLFLGLLRVGGRRYLGHPDVGCAWTRNLDAAGFAAIEAHDGRRTRVAATLLPPGPERDAVIRATFRQHPFPGNVCYWLLRTNLRAMGRFYRLTEVASAEAAADAPRL